MVIANWKTRRKIEKPGKARRYRQERQKRRLAKGKTAQNVTKERQLRIAQEKHYKRHELSHGTTPRHFVAHLLYSTQSADVFADSLNVGKSRNSRHGNGLLGLGRFRPRSDAGLLKAPFLSHQCVTAAKSSIMTRLGVSVGRAFSVALGHDK